ncbi:hypothetical protein BX616_010889 [Lobosporangium transversale]|uniref:Pyridoxal phosphate-dependent transferase n=1 Tax=Lobosporangium transversale TaxID=64571 RepID=A0A1Y2G574_9FUNG|nr:pyridoxal phosphate-dependent transferase [Lobosporangium transversale]KAF9910295.1 hypothetical protein BX616_010889 [Lobosporangium transversale]ORY94315.1 pyridoxal phosphate-dependent transferase [Lobosporangium transversale]|eukprot:XP_021875258.1 pyridoxal phosphate-dependent transferase [Lobosporangium transversale]
MATQVNYQDYLSESSKSRKPSAIGRLVPLKEIPGMISLGSGSLNPKMIPYEGIDLLLKTGEKLSIDPDTLQSSLNYSLTEGIPQLTAWLKEFQHKHHAPPREFSITIGTGSLDLITKALYMLINDGDSILLESPGYDPVCTFLRHQPCNTIDVELDSYGIVPSKLRKQLENWSSDKNGRKPKALYTVPHGSNPSGVSQTLERKKEIYQIARDHGLLIFEDDPYYYLQYDEKLVPSYLSMDVDGRVLRFDSMSKVLSAGLRIGWATGPSELIETINMITQSSNLMSSGVAQAVAYTLLKNWGHQGFYEHTRHVAAFYHKRSQVFCKYARKHLEGLAEFTEPNAGIFVWLKLKGIKDSTDLAMNKAKEKKVLIIPGVDFLSHPERDGSSPYVRTSFSDVAEEDMGPALERLATLLREHQE